MKKQIIEHYGGKCSCCGIKEINFLLHLLADIEDVYTKRLLLVPKGIRILRRGIREYLNLYHKKPQDS